VDLLTRALDVQDEWMVGGRHVEERVVTFAGASAVEAVEANIEAAGVVLNLWLAVCIHGACVDTYDRFKALSTVLAVH